ncbi:MAG: hypothetical protein ACPGYV_09620 [Phycisphaeraceae bacterium]
MRYKQTLLIATGLLLFTGCASLGEGNKTEEELTLDQCPPAVQNTIRWLAKDGEITEIERETEDGQTHYEAEFLLAGREYEAEIKSDGTLLIMELDEDEEEQETRNKPDLMKKM